MMKGGKQNGRAGIGTILLLMCMFVPSLMLVQPTEEQTCPHGDYSAGKGICCNKCSPGFKLVKKCQAEGQRSTCVPCPANQYLDEMNSTPNCRRCKQCKPLKHEVEESKCARHQNTICRCEDGYYEFVIDSGTSECHRCTPCGPDERQKEPCTPKKNTVCECKENFYRVDRECVPCKNCTAKCKHHCTTLPSTKTTDPGNSYGFLTNIIIGVVVTALFALVLVILVTHKATKWFIKKKFLKVSSQPADEDSADSFEVLCKNEEPSSNDSNKAVPQTHMSETESSNLPDCIPLEIKTSELIYTLLDLVPVLQMKQLVRSLGVTDAVVERAELDHRFTKEAHYQMLRTWAEKGTTAGRGGQGGVLHWQLLQELLDTLREMQLGWAAEELETKYSIH